MPPDAATTGRCLCGAVRYEAGPMRGTNHCHCESCRRATSSPFTTWFTVDAATLRWTGAAPVAYASSPGVTRRFCGRCGAPLSYEAAARPGEVDLLAASLDDPSGVRPERHDHWDERLPWVALADTLPRR